VSVSDLSNALFITLAGMGLVFAAILLFWGAMSLMMRLIAGRQQAEPAVETGAGPAGEATGLELRRRAALAAVAVALALEAEDQPRPFPLPPPVLVNTWQSVMRARHLARRGDLR
jgi:Na+-transporting methylmalonyl-CoA/oxaloacetate decarboxylase gamma subunit